MSSTVLKILQYRLAPLGVILAIAHLLHPQAAIVHEDFSSPPQNRGWVLFGDTNLFHWSPTNQNLQVTWDSSRPNSYFKLPLQTILGRQDDFSAGFDLLLSDVMGGTSPQKPSTFQLAIGFQNGAGAASPAFARGSGTNSPNL